MGKDSEGRKLLMAMGQDTISAYPSSDGIDKLNDLCNELYSSSMSEARAFGLTDLEMILDLTGSELIDFREKIDNYKRTLSGTITLEDYFKRSDILKFFTFSKTILTTVFEWPDEGENKDRWLSLWITDNSIIKIHNRTYIYHIESPFTPVIVLNSNVEFGEKTADGKWSLVTK